jgi:hypothetical protein
MVKNQEKPVVTSPEELYSLFLIEVNAIKNVHVRRCKNFDKAKQKDDWKFFEGLAGLINRNNGQIDATLYIRGLAKYFNGWFKPEILVTRKAITIYKDYIKNIEDECDPTKIKQNIIDSIRFIIYFCKKHQINCLEDYLSHDLYLIPSVLKHLNAGSISLYFFANVPNIQIYLANYPQDTLNEYFDKYRPKFDVFRMRVVNNKELKKIMDGVSVIISAGLNK